MTKLHQQASVKIEAVIDVYKQNSNMYRKPRVFQDGDLVLVHMRKERFPNKSWCQKLKVLISLRKWCMVWILTSLCISFHFQMVNWFTRMQMTIWRPWCNYTNKFVWRLKLCMTCTNRIPTCIGNHVSYKMVTWFRRIWGKNVLLTKGRTKVDAKSWRSLQSGDTCQW